MPASGSWIPEILFPDPPKPRLRPFLNYTGCLLFFNRRTWSLSECCKTWNSCNLLPTCYMPFNIKHVPAWTLGSTENYSSNINICFSIQFLSFHSTSNFNIVHGCIMWFLRPLHPSPASESQDANVRIVHHPHPPLKSKCV